MDHLLPPASGSGTNMAFVVQLTVLCSLYPKIILYQLLLAIGANSLSKKYSSDSFQNSAWKRLWIGFGEGRRRVMHS